ncbi:CHAT domain-containing protein [Streptomyces sp. NPDC053069]|uniref:CHAT domain-containing tetratricopeptide repeat protein n=1 Tax=Streptomyces sp. NPDC053069 TaxID=3365695 RepID=UPI0037D78590
MTENGPADRLAALIGAETLDAAEQLVRQNGELTSSTSMELLREWEQRAAGAQDRQAADVFSFHRRLLYRCRVVGVAETFGELRGRPVGVTDTWETALAATAAYEDSGSGTERARAEEAWRRVLELVPYEADRLSPQARTAALDGLARLLFSSPVTDTGPDAAGPTLDEVVALWRQAVGEAADPAEAAGYRTNLGAALARRYERNGDLQDVAEAVDAFTAASRTASAEALTRAGAFTGLGNVLIARFEAKRASADADAAVYALQQAVDLVPEGDPARAEFVNNLGLGLLNRYEAAGAFEDLDHAVAALESALDALDEAAPQRPRALANLANARLQTYESGADPADLERAVVAVEQALALRELTPDERPGCLNTYAGCLLARHTRSGDLDDLDLAIDAGEQAVENTPATAPERAMYLDTLASARRQRFLRTGDRTELRRAVRYAEQAVDMTGADATERARRLATLADCLATTRDGERVRSDLLDTIVARSQEAFDLTPGHSPQWWLHASNLAAGLLDRYETRRDPADLDRACHYYEQAIAAVRPRSAELAALSYNLAVGLRLRHDQGAHARDGRRAAEALRRAARIGLVHNPQVALLAARTLGDWTAEREAWDESACAYAIGLKAMHRLVRAQTTRVQRETWLRMAQRLPARAAFAMVMAGRPPQAATGFEHGRALVLSEVLERERVDLSRLRAHGHGALADCYQRAAQRVTALERADPGDAQHPFTGPGAPRRRDAHDAARTELNQAITAIRATSGFSGFLRSTDAHRPARPPDGPPVVYLIPAPAGGQALVVDGDVRTVALPALTEGAVASRATDFLGAQATRSVSATVWETCLDDVTRWLWDAVMAPVLTALHGHGHAVLVAAGELNLLPLHAAWRPASTASGRWYALDQMLLTYAPNARALDVARRLAAEADPTSLLMVDAVGSGRAVDLPTIGHEVNAALGCFRHHRRLTGPDCSVPDVLAAMTEHPVLHFACHGIADLDHPLDSALLLAQGELTLRDVLEQRLTSARVAVLSACESALSGTVLPDEAVGLPTGLSEAGAAGVVGSLWRVPDITTTLLVSRFYENWRQKGLEPAQALRRAQIWVRDSTNGDKARRFPDIPEVTRPGMPALHRRFWQNARPHTGPTHWAAFTYTGM